MEPNLAYERARNALIPRAQKFANRSIRGKEFKNKQSRDDAWNSAFHSEMQFLSRYLCRLETQPEPCKIPYSKDLQNMEGCPWRIEAPEFNNCAKIAWGKGPFTLEECGKMLGVTREMVRQIEEKGLTKIKKRGSLRKTKENLREFVEL